VMAKEKVIYPAGILSRLCIHFTNWAVGLHVCILLSINMLDI